MPRKNTGRINTYALAGSALIHLAVITAFALTQFSHLPPAQQTAKTVLTLQAQQSSILENKIYPKPNIIRPEPQKPSLENLNIPSDFTPPAQKTKTQKTAPTEIDTFLNDVSSPVLDNIEFFGTSTASKRACYVVDASGSMQGHFNSVKAHLISSISAFQQNQYFSIIFYCDNKIISLPNSGFLRASTKNIAQARTFINSIRPSGPTKAIQALKTACRLASEHDSSSVIFFLTDGFELAQTNPETFVTDIIDYKNATAPKTPINTIGFKDNEKSNQILSQIAAQSNGRSVIAN